METESLNLFKAEMDFWIEGESRIIGSGQENGIEAKKGGTDLWSHMAINICTTVINYYIFSTFLYKVYIGH